MITTTTKLDLKLDFSSSLLAVVHSSQANERSGDMSHVYDHEVTLSFSDLIELFPTASAISSCSIVEDCISK